MKKIHFDLVTPLSPHFQALWEMERDSDKAKDKEGENKRKLQGEPRGHKETEVVIEGEDS